VSIPPTRSLSSETSLGPAPHGSARVRHPFDALDRALHALRTYLDSWRGIGAITVGMNSQGYDLQLTP
jgi:hypothetical protein